MSNLRRAKSADADELRLWAREVYPMLAGMSARQVMSNRRKWIAATQYLGPKWRMRLREVRKFHAEPALAMVRG